MLNRHLTYNIGYGNIKLSNKLKKYFYLSFFLSSAFGPFNFLEKKVPLDYEAN